MKKFLLVLVLCFAVNVPAFAGENFLSNFFDKCFRFNRSVDEKLTQLQEKSEAQQEQAREQKIIEQRQKRQEVYEANQKRLEEKREQLRKLLEE